MSDAGAAQKRPGPPWGGSPIFGSLRRCFSVMCRRGHTALVASCTDLKSGTPNSQSYSFVTPKRILLLHITSRSGHHKASLAIEGAIRALDPTVQIFNLDSFRYTNPFLSRLTNSIYYGVIKAIPEAWDYLYDNPKLAGRVFRYRDIIHRFNSRKMGSLLEGLKPDVVVCTQAFPCGMVADLKISRNLKMPLVGVLTDYLPHAYWIYDGVDKYIVHTDAASERLIKEGVSPEKVKAYGIPIDTKFKDAIDRQYTLKRLGLDGFAPVVLVMGGGSGFGPIRGVLKALDRSAACFQMIVVAGANRSLLRWVERHKPNFKKKITSFGYVNNVHELMGIATLIITKPGGITTAEALARNLPVVIVNPIPGQEENNTRFLVSEGIAVKGRDAGEVAALVDALLSGDGRMVRMKDAARRHAKPLAANRIAEMVLEL